jgi:hypothetical protein
MKNPFSWLLVLLITLFYVCVFLVGNIWGVNFSTFEKIFIIESYCIIIFWIFFITNGNYD